MYFGSLFTHFSTLLKNTEKHCNLIYFTKIYQFCTKTCQFCSEKHHTSICKKRSNMLLTTNTSHVTNPVVVTEVECVKGRALIDTGAGSSYVSSKLISELNKKQFAKKVKELKQ